MLNTDEIISKIATKENEDREYREEVSAYLRALTGGLNTLQILWINAGRSGEH